MAFEMKPNPPLANGDITKKPWTTYTSSILNEKGEVTNPKTKISPADRLRNATKGVIEAKDKIIEETDHITGGDGLWEKYRNNRELNEATESIKELTAQIKNT